MASFNKVVFVGRLTRDVETRSFPNGGLVANFGFAVANRKKNATTGVWEDEPMFIDCAAWNRGEYKLAQIIYDHCRKGSQILIEGRLDLETWQDKTTGANRSKHKVIVESIQLLDPKPHGGGPAAANGATGGYGAGPAEQPASYSASEDIPF